MSGENSALTGTGHLRATSDDFNDLAFQLTESQTFWQACLKLALPPELALRLGDVGPQPRVLWSRGGTKHPTTLPYPSQSLP